MAENVFFFFSPRCRTCSENDACFPKQDPPSTALHIFFLRREMSRTLQCRSTHDRYKRVKARAGVEFVTRGVGDSDLAEQDIRRSSFWGRPKRRRERLTVPRIQRRPSGWNPTRDFVSVREGLDFRKSSRPEKKGALLRGVFQTCSQRLLPRGSFAAVTVAWKTTHRSGNERGRREFEAQSNVRTSWRIPQ